jgi:hypothetical protein
MLSDGKVEPAVLHYRLKCYYGCMMAPSQIVTTS